MGVVKVVVVSASNLKNTDTGILGDVTDPYVTVNGDGQWFITKVIKNNLNPKWGEEFTITVSDPTSVIFFNLWDSDNWSNDDLLGGAAVSLAGLIQNEPKTLNLPLLRRHKEASYGTLTVQLTAVDFSGLADVAHRLELTEQKLSAEVAKLGAEVAELHKVKEELKAEVDRFSDENNKYHELNEKLSATSEQLQHEVNELKGEVSKFHEENTKLEATRKELEGDVAALGNKIGVLSGEITNLQHTREMLDVQVTRQEEQNNQLAAELGKLHTIEEGMKKFAAQQGSDYQKFVDQLTSSLNQHEKLIHDFANENQKLKKNRRQCQIDSLLALSNSFQNWDNKVGLSVREFESYMAMLGPSFQSLFTAKFGGSLEKAFAKLDSDKNGTLNIPELRTLLNELIEEEKEEIKH